MRKILRPTTEQEAVLLRHIVKPLGLDLSHHVAIQTVKGEKPFMIPPEDYIQTFDYLLSHIYGHLSLSVPRKEKAPSISIDIDPKVKVSSPDMSRAIVDRQYQDLVEIFGVYPSIVSRSSGKSQGIHATFLFDEDITMTEGRATILTKTGCKTEMELKSRYGVEILPSTTKQRKVDGATFSGGCFIDPVTLRPLAPKKEHSLELFTKVVREAHRIQTKTFFPEVYRVNYSRWRDYTGKALAANAFGALHGAYEAHFKEITATIGEGKTNHPIIRLVTNCRLHGISEDGTLSEVERALDLSGVTRHRNTRGRYLSMRVRSLYRRSAVAPIEYTGKKSAPYTQDGKTKIQLLIEAYIDRLGPTHGRRLSAVASVMDCIMSIEEAQGKETIETIALKDLVIPRYEEIVNLGGVFLSSIALKASADHYKPILRSMEKAGMLSIHTEYHVPHDKRKKLIKAGKHEDAKALKGRCRAYNVFFDSILEAYGWDFDREARDKYRAVYGRPESAIYVPGVGVFKVSQPEEAPRKLGILDRVRNSIKSQDKEINLLTSVTPDPYKRYLALPKCPDVIPDTYHSKISEGNSPYRSCKGPLETQITPTLWITVPETPQQEDDTIGLFEALEVVAPLASAISSEVRPSAENDGSGPRPDFLYHLSAIMR